MDPNAFNKIEVLKTFYIYKQCLLFMWLFKRILKKMNGRKKNKQDVWKILPELKVMWQFSEFWMWSLRSWTTTGLLCMHVGIYKAEGHSLHQFFRYTIFFLPTSLHSFIIPPPIPIYKKRTIWTIMVVWRY